MGDDLQKWKGLLKWSMSQTAGSPSGQRRPVSEEDKKFFQDAMRENTIDIVQRMREITMVMSMLEQELKDQGVTTEDLIEMLEELQDLVGQIDYANDLHSIGGLVPLLKDRIDVVKIETTDLAKEISHSGRICCSVA